MNPASTESAPFAGVTRRWLVRTSIAVAASLAMFAVLTVLLLRSSDDDATVIGAASIAWDPDIDDALGEGKAASIEIIDDDGEFSVYVFDIDVLRTPADFEQIEAWLVEVDGATEVSRVSIGTFDTIRTRLFSLPDGTDPRGYGRVEFSLEPIDDDPVYSGRRLMGGDVVWLVEPPEVTTSP